MGLLKILLDKSVAVEQVPMSLKLKAVLKTQTKIYSKLLEPSEGNTTTDINHFGTHGRKQ